ncbi:hypothetical protein ACTMSW_08915 [Micromonospora sp. BQ11]|uniref:hypothetical protein n=1 Tax=Micromonospora sp. BQ11 TaxID=3452212 RepID=UPI003F8B2C29
MSGLLAMLTVTFAAPVQADTRNGCNYPRVCFYKTLADANAERPTATFQDKGSWQRLGSRSYGAYSVYNSRNDDGALIHFTNGTTYCVFPGEYAHLAGNIGTADMIMIMDAYNCAAPR